MILSYQGLEEENFDQKSPGPPGWGLMQRASSSLITKKNAKKPNTKPRKADGDLEADQWLNRKEWCLGSGRRRQLSQDRKDR